MEKAHTPGNSTAPKGDSLMELAFSGWALRPAHFPSLPHHRAFHGNRSMGARMNTRRKRSAFAAAAATGFTAAGIASSPVQAQTQLPGIVVEGATLEREPARPRIPTPGTAPAAQGTTPRPKSSSGGAPSGLAEGAATVPAASTEATGGTPIENIGSAVTVVTGEELRSREIRTVAEALRGLPGVHVVRSGSIAGYTEVRLRGGEANGTKVMIDGIEANDPSSGAFDFSMLMTDGVDRIEIIRGGQSVIYGSGATGGAINIITRKGYGPATVTVTAEGGSFDSREASVRVAGGTDRIWGSAIGAWRQTDGFNIAPSGSERDGSTLRTLIANGGFRPLRDFTVDFNVRKSESHGDRDGFGGIVPGSFATAVDDPSTFSSEVLLAGVNIRWDMLDGRLTHVVKAAHNRTITTDNDLSFPAFPFFSKYDSTVDNIAYVPTYRFDIPALWRSKHSITGLIEQQEETFAPLGDFSDGSRRDRGRVGTAAEWKGDFADRLFLTAGIRHDDNDAFKDFTVWRTTASLKLSEIGLRPHASVGTSYRTPTLFEQYGSLPVFYRPNPDLAPEEAFGWDAGVETTLLNGRAILDVTYFNDVLTSKIGTNPQGPPAPSLVNFAGDSTREGIETTLRLQILHGLTAGVSYTYLEAFDSDGRDEIRRPRHAARFDIDYSFHQGRGKLHFGASYNGSRQDQVFVLPLFSVDRVWLDDYWVFQAAASYKVAPNVELFARAENLFDAKYQELYGYETAGFAAFAGVRLKFEDTAHLASLK